MEKIKLMNSLINDMRTLTNTLEKIVQLENCKEDNNKEEKILTLEEVRAVLAEKSRSGKTAEVKGLLTKFGVNKLSELDASKYDELLKETEGI